MYRGVGDISWSGQRQVKSLLWRYQKAADRRGIRRPTGLTFRHADEWFSSDYEDFLDLPPAWQTSLLAKMQREKSWAWTPIQNEPAVVPQSRPDHAQPHMAFHMAFPRLVRAWPGLSKRVLPIPQIPLSQKEDKREVWPPKTPLYKAILRLQETAKLPMRTGPTTEDYWNAELSQENAIKRAHESGLNRFMAEVLKLVEEYSLLDPNTGDSIWNWYDFFRELTFLDELRKELYASAEDMKAEGKRTNVWQQQRDTRQIMDQSWMRALRKAPHSLSAGVYEPTFKYRVGAQQTLESIRNDIIDSCNTIGLRGQLAWSWWGSGLEVGARQWALVEMAMQFGHSNIRRCIICQTPIEGRSHKETCTKNSTCRSEKKRQRDAAKNSLTLAETRDQP